MVKAYAEHVKGEMAAQAQQAAAFNRHLIAKARETFGQDLPRFAREADAGGRAVFGEEVWGEMRKITAFVNDPRIITALSRHGRAQQTDGGAGAGGEKRKENDLAQRWHSSSVG